MATLPLFQRGFASAKSKGEDRGRSAAGWPDVRIWGLLCVGKGAGEGPVLR